MNPVSPSARSDIGNASPASVVKPPSATDSRAEQRFIDDASAYVQLAGPNGERTVTEWVEEVIELSYWIEPAWSGDPKVRQVLEKLECVSGELTGLTVAQWRDLAEAFARMGCDATSARLAALHRAASVLTASLEPQRRAGYDPEKTAMRLLGFVRGTTLDLSSSSAHIGSLLHELGPAAWTALDGYAQARSGSGLACVQLPGAGALEWLPLICEGLNRLAALKLVSVPAPEAGEVPVLDLRPLQPGIPPAAASPAAALAARPTPMIEVRLGRRREPFEVQVSAGTRVKAKKPQDGTFVARAKAKVTWWQAGHRAGKPRPLGAMIYDRKADDFGGSRQAQRAFNPNGAIPLARRHAGVRTLIDLLTLCRHWSDAWSHMRRLYRDAKAADASRALSYLRDFPMEAPGTTPARDLELESRKLLDAGARDILESCHLGAWQADEFERMDDAGESFRQFCLGTDTHLLAFDLRIDRFANGDSMDKRFIVTFYDPNTGGMHSRQVAGERDDLRSFGLQDWLAPDHLANYFTGPNRLLAVFDWPPGSGPREAASRRLHFPYVSDAARLTPEFMHNALLGGFAAAVDDCAQRARNGGLTDAELERIFAADSGAKGHFAIMSAASSGHADAVEAWMKHVLAERRLARPRATLLQHMLVLDNAFDAAQSETVSRYARLVGGAGEDALDAPTTTRLLLGWVRGSTEPVLHRLAAARGFYAPDPQLRVKQHDTIYRYLRTSLELRSVDEKVKRLLCASKDDVTTAARAALDGGNPGAAAAMLCAIIDASEDESTAETLCESLGVGDTEIIEALRLHPEDSAWEQRIHDSLGKTRWTAGSASVGGHA